MPRLGRDDAPTSRRAAPAAPAAAPLRHRDAARFILDQARAAVETVDDFDVERLVDLIQQAGNVIVFGRGRSGFVGRGFTVRLMHLGVPAYFVGETVTPPVRQDDLVIVISGSGETFSVVVTAQTAKDLGCRIVTITGNPDSTLARLSDQVVLLRTPTGDRQRALAPLGTVFETSSMIFLDGLIADLMATSGATEESMRSRHATLE